MLGNDGGLYFSYDGSKTWDFIDNLPIGQYYDISVDTRDPYWVYGGTQDNGTWALPVRTYSMLGDHQQRRGEHRLRRRFLHDSRSQRSASRLREFAKRPHVSGGCSRRERRKASGRCRPDAKETYRFNWSTPMFISPHDSRVVYYGGNKLFRTADRGHKWDVISPDLTLESGLEEAAAHGAGAQRRHAVARRRRQ